MEYHLSDLEDEDSFLGILLVGDRVLKGGCTTDQIRN